MTAKSRPFASLRAGGASVRIYRGDCLAGMAAMPARSVDVVVTSPPYNIGVRYSAYRDDRSPEDYLDWMEAFGEGVARVLSPGGSFFLNVGTKPSEPWTAFDVAQRMRGTFVLQNVIHWVKSIAIPKADAGNYANVAGDIAVGHYKPIGGKRFLHDCHEYIFHFTKRGTTKLDRLAVGVPYQDKSNIGRWAKVKEDLRCRGNTWFIPYETIRDRASQRPHPSTFPVRLPEMCILLHGVDKTDLVLDPFLGLGSTAVAAMRLGKHFEGFEIDAAYLKAALKRLVAEGAMVTR